MNQPKRILVPILTGLGNCVMLTPLLRTLKATFPEGEIHLFTDGRWNVQELFTHSRLVSGIHFQMPAGMDLVLVPRISGSLSFAAMARLKNPRARIVAHAMPAEQPKAALKNVLLRLLGTLLPQPFTHESLQNLELLQPLGISPEKWVREAGEISEGDPDVADSVGVPYVLIQPGASNGLVTPKRWPVGEWAALIRGALARGLTVVLIGDKAERELGQAIAAEVSTANLKNFCGETTIPQMIGLVRKARLVVAADSGVGHLAGAVGVPLISVWGPTSWTRSQPLGNVDKVSLDLPCAPCTGEPGLPSEPAALEACPIGNACMTTLRAELVMDAMLRRLR